MGTHILGEGAVGKHTNRGDRTEQGAVHTTGVIERTGPTGT